MARQTTSPTSVPRLLRGSVVTHRHRCGKATCRCADGQHPHESVVLSYSEQGRTRFLALPPELLPAVRRATERYRAQKTRLLEQADQGLAELVAALAPSRSRRS
jgi:hypothetical protein